VSNILDKNLSIDIQLEKYLVKNNILSDIELEAAKMEQSITEDHLGAILVRNGFLHQDILIKALIKITNKNLVHEEIILPHIPPELLYELRCKIAAQTIEEVYVATLGNEDETLYRLKSYFPSQQIILIDADSDSVESYLEKLKTIHDSEASLLETLVRDAIMNDVSDIHIVPRTSSFTVLNRRFGVRKLEMEGDKEDYLTLSARIKDRSRMDLAERRKPQDGGFNMDYNGRIVDLRVATVPTLDGEVIVIRILDPAKANKKLNELGITNIKDWEKGASRLNGLCLITGATGSGKTTTLNATVRQLDRFGKSIYTAEDPVEYSIPYVVQVNINEAVGLDFSRALKSFMRSDPDVIILGEIRDADTARNAIKAAETGHLVFATLHTSSIISSVNRMRDLGVPAHELKYVLRAILTQTLIRITCTHCDGTDSNCQHCRGGGYMGRKIVSECHYFSSMKDTEEVLEKKEIKWVTMIEDAYRIYASGETTREEFIRVFGAEAEDFLENIEKEKNEINNDKLNNGLIEEKE
jgi:type II secretory ATPase GspE/PulE/Tfp pilus assembly ATPase PilB-like protein